MKVTVNEAMVLAKAIRGRYAELSSLRSQSSTRETFFSEPKKIIEPVYDVKVLDKKCVELENFLLSIDTKIKQSNAVTHIEFDGDVKVLMSPLT